MERLRLFPLQTVLFPGMTLPLIVFEARYRLLVRECLEGGEPFGVALIREGLEVGGPAFPHALGTTARIRRVTVLDDGRLEVEAVGERRFRTVALHHDQPYLSADVEYPVDEPALPAGELLESARERYEQVVRLRHMITGEYERVVPMPGSPSGLADAVGALQMAPTEQLQRLLEAADTRSRLQRATEVLEAALVAAHQHASRAVADRYGGIANLN